MALGFIANPAFNFSCKLELPCFHTPSLGSLISHRPLLKRVHLSSRYHCPHHPGLPKFSVIASSLWKQPGLVNEESRETNNSSTYELSSVLLDILKQRSESGLSNDVVELEDKDANESSSNFFMRRRRGDHVENEGNHESRSPSTDTEVSPFRV